MKYLERALPILVLVFAFTVIAQADAVTDAAFDFVPTYGGPQTADLDILSANVTFNGSSFHLTAELRGAIGTTPGAAYVFGFDRGAGTARFNAIAPGVLFDSVVLISPGNISRVVDFVPAPSPTTLPDANITISGNSLSVLVPLALLPSEGLAPGAYTWNLWGLATGLQPGVVAQSDFAPDNSNATVTTVPEPATMLLLGTGLVGIGGMIKRRRQGKE